jgi:DNA invertase Pin-like site-specific DNA recombinase
MRAAIYARISSDRDGEALGVERQLADCRKLCGQRGWDISGEYVDNDISAATPGKKRPEHERLMSDIRAGKLDAVVVWDVDRLYRQPRELEPFVDACEAAKLQVLGSVGGDMDLNDESSLFMLRMKVNLAAMEIAKLRKRMKRKQQELAENGLSHGGQRAFGFEPDGITIRESEAVHIRQAAERLLEGASRSSIVRDWNEHGVLTVTGSNWTVTRLRQLLERPRLAGIRQYQGQEIGNAVWDPILDETTWRRVLALMKDPARQPPNLNEKPDRVYPLRGVLRCGECGQTLTAMYKMGHRTYGCRKVPGLNGGHVFIRADLAEEWVRLRLIPWADDARMRNMVSTTAGSQVEEIKKLVSENVADEAKTAEWAEMFTNGETDRQTYSKQTVLIRKRIDERLTRIANMRGQSTLDQFGGSVVEGWDSFSPEDQRSVIFALVDHIDVDTVKGTNGTAAERLVRRMRFQWRTTEMLEDGQMIDEYGNIYRAHIVGATVEEVPEKLKEAAKRWAS